jgi:hypothetical protein
MDAKEVWRWWMGYDGLGSSSNGSSMDQYGDLASGKPT